MYFMICFIFGVLNMDVRKHTVRIIQIYRCPKRQKLFRTSITQRRNFVGPTQLYVTGVIQNLNILRVCGGSEVGLRFKCVLDLRSFLVNKIPEDITLVPKHVAVWIQYEVCFMICSVVI
jgi:hypothetical protein